MSIAEKAAEIYMGRVGDPARLIQYLGRLMTDSRVPGAAKAKVVGSGLYTWVDGDLIPDPIRYIPGMGFIDDFILVLHGITCLIGETETAVAVELWPGNEASFKRTMTAVKWLDDQLYGRIRGGLRSLFETLFGNAAAGAQRSISNVDATRL